MIIEVDLNMCMAYNLDIKLYVMLVLLQRKEFEKIKEFFDNRTELFNIIDQLVSRKYIALSNFGIKDRLADYKILFFPSPKQAEFDEWFDELINTYPKKVTRVDGSEGSLLGRLHLVKELYRKAIKGNKDRHLHIIECLKYQLQYLQNRPGGLMYMKGLYRWVLEETWKDYEQSLKQVKENILNDEIGGEDYGGRII